MFETRTRSLLKAVVWRIVGAGITFGTVYFFTGTVEESLRITIAAEILITIAYYFHERVWNVVEWGRTGDHG